MREVGREEGEREGGREGEREGGREVGREGGRREGGREVGREGGSERGREVGREGEGVPASEKERGRRMEGGLYMYRAYNTCMQYVYILYYIDCRRTYMYICRQ